MIGAVRRDLGEGSGLPLAAFEVDRALLVPDVDVLADTGGIGEHRDVGGRTVGEADQYVRALVDSLGLDRTNDGTVAVDSDGETSVPGVYAVGDLTPGHNQIPVAMGEGAKAGISIHYDIRTFPMSKEEIEAAGGEISAEDVPAIGEELRTQAREHAGKAGEAGTSEAAGDD